VLVPIALFIIFEIWFLVPLPKGPFEAWLGY
jgi:putative tricarboxylic transport membrane protein